jgi:hypothetical protein
MPCAFVSSVPGESTMTSTSDTHVVADVVRFPVRPDFDPELTKRDLARMWRCSAKTIVGYVDPDYAGPRGLRPLPSFTTPLGRRRFRLSEVEEWRAERRTS